MKVHSKKTKPGAHRIKAGNIIGPSDLRSEDPYLKVHENTLISRTRDKKKGYKSDFKQNKHSLLK